MISLDKRVSATTKTNRPGEAKRLPRQNRLLPFLLGGLGLVIVAFLVARVFLAPKPAVLPANAGVEEQRRYWSQRIKADVSDQEAYVRLGQLEERSGFYMSAIKYLRAARLLGAPDSVLCASLGRALSQVAQNADALPELQKAYRLSPDRVEAIVNLAGVAATEGQFQEASTLLKAFLTAHPQTDPNELRRLMFCFLECEEEQEAGHLADRILTIVPDDLVSRGVAARAALGRKDYTTARQQLEAILKQEPNDAASLYLYGTVLKAVGDENGALLQWEKAVALNPKALDPYEQIGTLYEKRNDVVRAAVAYENLARLSPSDLTARRAALALKRAHQEEKAAYWSAVTAGFAGDFPTAVREGQVAAQSKDPVIRRQGLGAVAEAYRGLKQREPFMATMRQLTAGGSVDDLVLLSQAYAQVDDHKARTECLLKALAKAPAERQPALRYDIAAIYRTRGMQAEAEQMIDAAVARDGKNAALRRLQAEIHYEHRAVAAHLDTAIQAWEAAVALDPNESADWQHLGVAYLATGQTLKAIRYLEHAIDLEPGSGPAYQELSRAYAKIGDAATSQKMMALYTTYVTFDQKRQTLRTRARRPHATAADIVAYADLEVKLSELNEAAFQYERALALTPNDSTIRQKLAVLYQRLRMPERLAHLQPVAPPAPLGAK